MYFVFLISTIYFLSFLISLQYILGLPLKLLFCFAFIWYYIILALLRYAFLFHWTEKLIFFLTHYLCLFTLGL